MNVKFDRVQTGENIKFYRKQRGWSKVDLAFRAERLPEAIKGFEAGEVSPSLETIANIANALGVHPDWLMAWEETE